MAPEQIQSIQGTEDVLPPEWGRWRQLYAAARRLFETYGYGRIRTPVIEETRLFVKGTGATTDIVEKEMYTIPGGEGDGGTTLRPEGTPGVVRSYLERSLHKQDAFQKLYYAGPMFRHERPQKGRLRQFHQIGVEAIGSDSPLLDAETIALATDIFGELGLEEFGVYLNSMGCSGCRPRIRREMREQLQQRRGELCEDCLRRIDRNVFRVLDCRNPGCREVVADLPLITQMLCEDCATHYDRVRSALTGAGVEFAEAPHLVRGLDYYTRTVYEIKHPGLGARDTICGGGRYDDLVEMLGGPSLPCVGFGTGVEPTLLAMEAELGPPEETPPRPQVYVVCIGDELRSACFELAEELRRAGVATDLDYEGRSPKSQMRVANRIDAPLCMIVGPEEAEAGEVTMKEMAGGQQWRVTRGEAVDGARQWLGRSETPREGDDG